METSITNRHVDDDQGEVNLHDRYLGYTILIGKRIPRNYEVLLAINNDEWSDRAFGRGEEGVKKLLHPETQDIFQLLITDARLFDMDGYVFVQRVKAIPRCRNIPVMIITPIYFTLVHDVSARTSSQEVLLIEDVPEHILDAEMAFTNRCRVHTTNSMTDAKEFLSDPTRFSRVKLIVVNYGLLGDGNAALEALKGHKIPFVVALPQEVTDFSDSVRLILGGASVVLSKPFKDIYVRFLVPLMKN